MKYSDLKTTRDVLNALSAIETDARMLHRMFDEASSENQGLTHALGVVLQVTPLMKVRIDTLEEYARGPHPPSGRLAGVASRLTETVSEIVEEARSAGSAEILGILLREARSLLEELKRGEWADSPDHRKSDKE
jgi:hypothetical protein